MVVSTHVRVLVQRARGLRTKGKNGTNNCFVAIELGKEKFVTSVVEKCEYPDWNEEAELSIPTQGNTAALILTVYHQNFMGLKDDFLGEVHLPLSQFDFENPKSRWYKLSGRGGKDDGKPRGDIEVHVSFSSRPLTASLTELHKKKSNSLKHLSSMAHSMGGSLMSLGKEKKSLKKLASSVGHKVSDKLNIKKHIRKSSDSSSIHDNRGQDPGEADPGVISEEDSDYDAPITPTSFTSSSTVPVGQSLESSFEGLNLAPLPIAGLPASKLGYKPSTYYTMGETNPQPTSYIPGDLKYAVLSSGGDRKKPLDGSDFKFIHNNNKDSLVLSSLTCHDRPGIDKENLETARAKFLSYSREELIQKIAQLEACLSTREQQVVDLECYIDNLLVRVMETSPKLLQCFHVH